MPRTQEQRRTLRQISLLRPHPSFPPAQTSTIIIQGSFTRIPIRVPQPEVIIRLRKPDRCCHNMLREEHNSTRHTPKALTCTFARNMAGGVHGGSSFTRATLAHTATRPPPGVSPTPRTRGTLSIFGLRVIPARTTFLRRGQGRIGISRVIMALWYRAGMPQVREVREVREPLPVRITSTRSMLRI